MDKVAVIGGGSAGIIAAGKAGSRGKRVILYEKNELLGKKLLITGGGRCNITNNCDIQELIENIVVNKDFLYSAFYTFTNQDIISLLNKYGVETLIEDNNRVFPKSNKSIDVLLGLEKFLKDNNVIKKCNMEVKDININSEGKFSIVFQNGYMEKFDKIVIATGGKSYPSTGSTGDGYIFAKKLGHSVKQLKPALVPVQINEEWIKKLQGVSLKEVELSIYVDDRKTYSKIGEMIFTHYGISGPIVLLLSNHLNADNNKKIKMKVDLKPDLTTEQLEKRIINIFIENPKKQVNNCMYDMLSKRMVNILLNLINIYPEKPANQITKEERRKLVNIIKGLEMNYGGLRPLSEAIITSGGISTKEINPSTMESKIVKGLFFAGEVIDVHGQTGGFNLQIAYSTGYLAGLNC